MLLSRLKDSSFSVLPLQQHITALLHARGHGHGVHLFTAWAAGSTAPVVSLWHNRCRLASHMRPVP